MENLTATEQLDYMLNGFYNKKFEELKNKYGPNFLNENELVQQVLDRLILDGNIKKTIVHDPSFVRGSLISYSLTFDGALFYESGGYKARALKDANDALWKKAESDRQRTLDGLLGNNSTRLNNLTHRMMLATWVAGGVAFLLLLWQIFLWFYPQYKDFGGK